MKVIIYEKLLNKKKNNYIIDRKFLKIFEL